MDCRSVHQGTGPAGGNDHERAKLEGTFMSGQSWREPFRNKQELADWCRDNQPYYKKRIPEVNSYFARMYNLK